MDRFPPQPMLADMPGRGMVELVPVTESHMLFSGPECKEKCYANFLMCGDHRMQTESKLTKFNEAKKIEQCRFLKSNCESMC